MFFDRLKFKKSSFLKTMCTGIVSWQECSLYDPQKSTEPNWYMKNYWKISYKISFFLGVNYKSKMATYTGQIYYRLEWGNVSKLFLSKITEPLILIALCWNVLWEILYKMNVLHHF